MTGVSGPGLAPRPGPLTSWRVALASDAGAALRGYGYPAGQSEWLWCVPEQSGIMLRVGSEATDAMGKTHLTLCLAGDPRLDQRTGLMRRNWMLAALAVAVVLTGCGDGKTPESAPATTPTQAATAPTGASTTKQPAWTTTTVSERLAYWREVVKTMNCPEVTDLELKRLAGHFADRPQSLIAIHDRQGELNCA
jgi:hypothetical protein